MRSAGSMSLEGNGQEKRSAAASCAAAGRLVPELHEPPDGPAAPAQPPHARPGIVLGSRRFDEQFRPVRDPFGKHPGFDVAQAASECLVAEHVPQQRITRD
jgi:hypothetical protein